ncbi:MAG: class I SAM-dependent methyltransferase [Bacillota bacterium]|jgi:predicted O-methyltransferase YrrM|nr:class I SAM-dependent methyltransferase [Bacillota bacterium]
MSVKLLKRLAERNGFTSVLYNLPRLVRGYQPIFLDYPVHPVPRYGYGKSIHPEISRILAMGDSRYAALLKSFCTFSSRLLEIPLRDSGDGRSPCWINAWLDGLDTLALYGIVGLRRPERYIEVGSGFSTRLVRRAIEDLNLPTKITSIDPKPRAAIDVLCDHLFREPLETLDLSIFSTLDAGDVLFIDSSHRSFMNSDVTVFFLEILPRLRRGVVIHIHDIYLPCDYLPERAHWFYSEQYLLAASLLGGHTNYDILLPNNYVAITPHLSDVLTGFWGNPYLSAVPRTGCSFWIEIR